MSIVVRGLPRVGAKVQEHDKGEEILRILVRA